MSFHVVAIILCVLFLFEPASADLITPTTKVDSFVTIRSNENNGLTLSRLKVGETAQLLKVKPKHYLIKTENGLQGYVLREWTRILDETHSQNTDQAVNTSQQLALHFLDVGQGDATYIQCPNNTSILIDAGSATHKKDRANQIRDYITELTGPNTYHLDHLIITHADPEHFNLLPSLLSDFDIGNIHHIADRRQYNNETFNKWLGTFPQSKVNKSNIASSNLNCGNANIELLSANFQAHKNWRNAASIVLKIKFGSFSAILSADATGDTEADILSRFDAKLLNVDLLKVSNHGIDNFSSSADWLATLQPEIVIISNQFKNRFGSPSDEFVRRLEAHTVTALKYSHPFSSSFGFHNFYQWQNDKNYNEQIFSTADNGNIIIRTNGEGYEIETRFHGK